MIAGTLTRISAFHDRLDTLWSDSVKKKYMGPAMVLIYLASLLMIELKLRGVLPPWLADKFADSHFNAIYIAFSFLLVFEVVDLIFGISSSVSQAFGKQLQIFALILLRNSFKSFEAAGEPLVWEGASQIVLEIVSDAFGAIIILLLLALYYRILRRHPVQSTDEEIFTFVSIKKLVSLGLFAVFLTAGVVNVYAYIFTGEVFAFFPFFFTVLILCDVLLVLVALKYATDFPIVFRNSGFAVATVLLRVALTAPVYFNIAIGVAAAVYAVGITVTYNIFLGARKE